MHPNFMIFGRVVPAYGLMTAIGIVCVVLYYKKYAGIRAEYAGDAEILCVFAMIGTFLGAKVLYVLTQLPSVMTDLPSMISNPCSFCEQYLSAGFVFYGGLYGCLTAMMLYCRNKSMLLKEVAKPMLPMIPLMHGIGRIGCFLEGCCYGMPSEHFGIFFSNSPIAPNDIPLLPVQLWEACFEFLACAIMIAACRHEKSGRVILGGYLLSYAMFRFFIEFFRYDSYRGIIGGFSVSQYISIITLLFGFVILASRHTQSTKENIPTVIAEIVPISTEGSSG